jgi:hypothetical protein
MLSVALTPSEHLPFTQAWGEALGYGKAQVGLTKEAILEEAGRIYQNHPVLLRALGIY